MLDFIRIACGVPAVRVGDVKKNAADVCAQMQQAFEQGSDLVVFPELALTGYTCADLFFQETLLRSAVEGLKQVVACSEQCPELTVAVGVPLLISGQMYNCAAVITNGRICGIVPKTYLPNYNEFYERRWFSSSEDLQRDAVGASELGLDTQEQIPVGRDLLFKLGDGCVLGVEICEDLWTPMPPSTLLTLNGAEVIVNLSASNETVGKRAYRRQLVEHQSAVCSCIYGYVSAGCTESTQDLVFSGHSMVAEDGTVLAENREHIDTDYLLVQDADSSANVLQLQRVPFAAAPLKMITNEKEFVDDHALDVDAMVSWFDSYKGRSKTSCPNPSDWLEAFGDAEEIYCVTITSGLSGSYNSASIAKQMYESEHEGRQVRVIDSLSAGPELALIIEQLETWIGEGKSFAEISRQIDVYQKNTGLVFMLESLKNFAANGRVSPAIAKLAGVLGIRIVGKASEQGTLEPTNKCRGEAKSLDAILTHMKENGLAKGKVRIAHCMNEGAAAKLKNMILEHFPQVDVGVHICRGLCSYYAEKGGLLVGYEKM